MGRSIGLGYEHPVRSHLIFLAELNVVMLMA
jgi:hypothetical protein